MTEDEMVGWHHRLNGHAFEQALGVGDGQGSLVCCRGHKRVGHEGVPNTFTFSLFSTSSPTFVLFDDSHSDRC